MAERSGRSKTPPGQYYAPDFTIYKVMGQPSIDERMWRLVVKRRGVEVASLSLEELEKLGVERLKVDFHCVTGWSVANVEWEGVPVRRLVEKLGIDNGFNWMYVESYDGYTTVVHRDDALDPRAMVALKLNGRPLEPEQGRPARLVFPHLYGWKGAKWVHILDFIDGSRDGYWAALGYHERGRVWEEERFKRTVV